MRLLKLVRLLVVGAVISSCGADTSTSASASYTVTVTPSTLAIALSPGATASANAIVTRQLGASSLIDNTATVTWTTSNAAVATVSPTGSVATITGLGHGVATITASSNGSTGSTTVTVTAPACTIGASNTAATVGSTVAGTLGPSDCRDSRNPNAPADFYRLVVSANQLVTIDVSASAFTPDIRLFSPTITTLETASGATARVQRALVPGTYTIAVGVASGSGGSYSLTVNTAAVTSCATYQTLATTSAVPATINGTLAVSDCRLSGSNLPAAQFFKITLASAQTVTAVLSSTAFPPSVNLYNSNDNYVSGGDSIGVGQVRLSSLLPAGVYYVRVTGITSVNPNPLGAFTLALSFAAANTSPACTTANFVSTIAPTSTGTTLTSSLTSSDCKLPDGSYYAKLYRLTVTSTVNVQIDMTSAVFNTGLYLFDANLNVLDINDDFGTGTDSRITRTLTPGTYFIGANSLNQGVVGAFNLIVKTVP